MVCRKLKCYDDLKDMFDKYDNYIELLFIYGLHYRFERKLSF